MSKNTTIIVIGSACGLFALAAYIAFILVPAWTAYARIWEKIVAAILSFYVFVAFVGIGVAAGIALIWYSDRLPF